MLVGLIAGMVSALAASVHEADPTNCIDREELELDQPWMPSEATVEVRTSVVSGGFGVDVRVLVDARTTWETRIPLQRADCRSAAETVALSVESGLRGRAPPTLGPRPPPPPPDLLLALGATVGPRGTAPGVGVRAAALRGRDLQLEVGAAAAEGLPIRLDPGGTAQLAEGLGTVSVGPTARLGAVRARAAIGGVAGVGLVAGSGLGVATRSVVPRMGATTALALAVGGLHVGLWGRAEVVRLRYEVAGGVVGDSTLEPLVRVGLEVGVLAAGKVGRSAGPPDP